MWRLAKKLVVAVSAVAVISCGDQTEEEIEESTIPDTIFDAGATDASVEERDEEPGEANAAESGETAPGILTADSEASSFDGISNQINGPVFTFRPEYLEIDRLEDGTSADFGDANLYQYPGVDPSSCTFGSGADPADGSCDARLPASNLALCTSPTQTTACRCTGDPTKDTTTCVDPTFIDWNELLTAGGASPDATRLATHRFLDPIKTDPTSFKNDSCLTTTKVLGKMDLTAAMVMNNLEYAYFGLKRYDNNGDAGYSWTFTDKAPTLDATFGSCSAGDPLVYELTQNDVLIKGNFNPSSGAQLIVRRATAFADGLKLIAADVVDPAATTSTGDPIWEPIPGAQNLAAVNTTITDPSFIEYISGTNEVEGRTDKGAFSTTSSGTGKAIGEFIFAESAVDFSAFTGGGASCDLTFFGRVITQPSSSVTSDLKDYFDAGEFNFGSLSASASLQPSCDKEIVYNVDQVTGPGINTTDPDSEPSIQCDWTFTHELGAQKTVSNDCSGVLPLDPSDPTGNWTGSVSIQVVGSVSCATTASTDSTLVYEPLGATADLTPTCGLDFDYTSTVSGGSGSVTREWTFSGPGAATPSTSASVSGSVSVTADGTYMGDLLVTDDRTDITCTAPASDSTTIAEQLAVTPTLSPTCELAFDYDATISGGISPPTPSWTFSGPGTTTPPTSSMQSGTVTVDADGTYTGTVRVEEMRETLLCSDEKSATVDAFGAIVPTVDLDESCQQRFLYSGSYSGGSGSAQFDWTFSGPGSTTPSTATNSSGQVDVGAAGTYTAELTITDDRSDITCSGTTSADVPVYEPLLIAGGDLTPTCVLAFDYTASVSGGSPARTQEWTFSGPGGTTPTTSSSSSGSVTVTASGTYTGELVVTDERSEGLVCSTSFSDTVDAYEPLVVTPTAEPLCDETFNYDASFTGGSGTVTYAWSFSGPGSTTPSTSTTKSGNVAVGVADEDYTVSVVVTDTRTDITCTDDANTTVHPLAPIQVSIAPNATAKACTDEPPDLVDTLGYTASVTGGDGAYTYSWVGCSSSTATCTVDPNDTDLCHDRTVYAVVDDGSSICPSVESERETYSKITTITSTNN